MCNPKMLRSMFSYLPFPQCWWFGASTLLHIPPPPHLPNGFSHYSQLYTTGSLFYWKPTATILYSNIFLYSPYICTTVHLYFHRPLMYSRWGFCTSHWAAVFLLMYFRLSPTFTPVLQFSGVHWSYSNLYRVLIGALSAGAFSNVWPI